LAARGRASRLSAGEGRIRTWSRANTERAILGRIGSPPDAAQIDRERELKIIRRAYARQVAAAAGVGDPRIEAAFAAVAREDFLGPGPWQIVRWGGGYRASPDADPVYQKSFRSFFDNAAGAVRRLAEDGARPIIHAARHSRQ
jgi:hypothetical protein